MDVYYAASISTSSRLSPPEEEELRNSVTETPQSLNSTYTDFKKQQRHNEEASSGLLASGIPNTPSNLNMKPTPGRILVTIADKGGKEVTNRGNYVEGQSQIQATATMDDLECGNPIDPAESITTRTKSPKPEIMTLADSTTRGMATTALEPSELFPTNDQDLGLSKPKDTEVPKVESSAVSVISTSPTLTSAPLQQGKGSLPNSHYNMRYQQQSQLQYNSLSLEAESPKMLKFQFDTEHFAIVFHELTIYTEQLESLNDQILEAMTLHQSMNISSEPTDATTVMLSTQDSARRPSSPEETRKRMKGKEKAVDLEEERFSMAQLFTDLVMDSWPRIYKIPSEPKTAQVTKDRIKAATKLKDMIVEFWGSQSQFQERAQLVLDVYQDPMELEHGDRIRILKSRHLNNLLTQEPLDPQEINRLLEKYKQHQSKLTVLSEQMQNVWLGILMLLGDPDRTQPSNIDRRLGISSMNLHAASSSSSYYLDSPPSESRRNIFRMSNHKRLLLKVTVLLVVGSGLIAMAMVLNAKVT